MLWLSGSGSAIFPTSTDLWAALKPSSQPVTSSGLLGLSSLPSAAPAKPRGQPARLRNMLGGCLVMWGMPVRIECQSSQPTSLKLTKHAEGMQLSGAWRWGWLPASQGPSGLGQRWDVGVGCGTCMIPPGPAWPGSSVIRDQDSS